MTQHFTTDNLDADTLAYLKRVSAAEGKRMPGIYNGWSDYWPVVGLVLGFVTLVVTALMTFPPTEEPTKEALLQTAGFLLGGWLILAAFRVWAATAAGKRLGRFVYADSQYLYEVKGTAVAVTDLSEIDEAKVTQNFNEGTYQNSHVAMKMGRERKEFTVYSEKAGRKMSVFLNALAYMRGGGEGGTDEQLKTLPPEEMAAIAKHIAATGNFPRNMADMDETDDVTIPAPRGGGSGGGGLLWYLLIIVAGAVLFFGFRSFNSLLREDTIYDRIMELPAKDQPPALRMYLSHPGFQKRRAEAEAKLDTAYRQATAQMIQGNNPEFAEAMRTLVMSLVKKPQPVISLAVEEEGNDPQAKSREDATATELADKWGSTIGDEFVIFAKPDDKEIKTMIHVAYRFAGPITTYTVTFRNGPDDEPFKTVTGAFDPTKNAQNFNVPPKFTDHLLGESCGITRPRPMVLPDQDF